MSRLRSIPVLLIAACGPLAGCLAIAGVSDFRVDESATEGGPNTPDGTTPDGTVPEGGGTDSPIDSPTDAPVPSPGLSDVTLASNTIAIGKTVAVILHARNETGERVARTGAKVVFTQADGTAAVTFSNVVDVGDGNYTATATGMKEGSAIKISATIDGALLKAPAPTLRVENVLTTGLTMFLDAENVDGLNHPGATGCPGNGLAAWADRSPTPLADGSLNDFADPCNGAIGSGWAGNGTTANPYRLVFDGVDDYVSFGTVNALPKHSIIAFVKKTGNGVAGITGTGGFNPPNAVFPIVAKGTAEGETDNIDINYHLSITQSGKIGSDYEQTGTHTNAPFMGATTLTDNQWMMIATTLDAPTVRGVWLDGKEDGSSPGGLAPSGAADARLVIGGANQSATITPDRGRFKGEIGVVLTYDRALTKAEMEQTCRAFAARFGITTCPK